MEIPNLRVSEMTLTQLRAMLNVCYSIYLGIDLEAAEVEEQAQTLCLECILYHGKLYVWKLRELFQYYSAGQLVGMEGVKPEIHSKFIYKMKKAYFDNLKK
jgi:hypothetical protein